MQTARRYDPTKDASVHVFIVTEEIRRQWATPRKSFRRPEGTVQSESALDEQTAAEIVETSKMADATIGPCPPP